MIEEIDKYGAFISDKTKFVDHNNIVHMLEYERCFIKLTEAYDSKDKIWKVITREEMVK